MLLFSIFQSRNIYEYIIISNSYFCLKYVFFLKYFGFVEVNNKYDVYILMDVREKLAEIMNKESTTNSNDNGRAVEYNNQNFMVGNDSQEDEIIITKSERSNWKLDCLLRLISYNINDNQKDKINNLLDKYLLQLLEEEIMKLDAFLKQENNSFQDDIYALLLIKEKKKLLESAILLLIP